MQSALPVRTISPAITLQCDETSSFNRHLLSLVKHWDKGGNVKIVCVSEAPQETPSQSMKAQLCVFDHRGGCWYGAEAVPIIFKNLPFGKLAAAMYILPGTMWFTKQIYALNKAPSLNRHNRWH